jgi:acetoin utilization protein AcuB
MDILAPVSTIMTKKLLTVNPKDKLSVVKEIFDAHKIHHLPVVRYKTIVGILSKSDLLYFIKGASYESGYDDMLNEARLNNYTAEEIMTTGMAKVSSTDRIGVAIEVFKENLFHAIPVVDNDELVGILTTYDIIRTLSVKDQKAV